MTAYSNINRLVLFLILALALALRLPGWFTQDEKTRFRLFEPDEFQHVQIAVYQVQCIDSTLLTDWDVERKMFNARGFGIQMGVLAWLNHQAWGMPLSIDNFVLIGRILSTLYALLLVLLLYYPGKLLSGKTEIALMAALLIAVCDLPVTYSHYALPEVSHVFWVYLFAVAAALWLRQLHVGIPVLGRKPWLYLAFLAWTAAAAFAAKFDFIPFFLSLGVLLFGAMSGKMSWGRALAFGTVFLLLFALSFGLQTTFNFSLERIQYSFWDLYRQNKNVIQEDQHWLTNPPVYLIAIIAGSSLPVAVFAARGLRALHKKKMALQPGLVVLLTLLTLEFAVLWSSDAPFVRRANIFMPAVALSAAVGWAQPGASKRKFWGAVMVLYTLGLCLVSQSNAWWDTRYAARAYLNEQHADRRIKYGSYAYAKGMPPGIPLREEEELLVLHEAAYSRYWRSFTTPFRIPECCSEVYHCSEEDCRKIQDIVAGRHPDYRLLKHFRTREYFPERILFKQYLGNFETFLGDVVVLEVRF